MTRFLLVRHAAHDWLGRGIAGRLPGVGLNAQGLGEAAGLAPRLRDRGVRAIYSSPQQRAQETAAPTAAALALHVQVDDALAEIDFGEWTGRTFDELEADAQRWRTWCERRSVAAAPGGEAFAAVQGRIMGRLRALCELHPQEAVALFSHGDVIKAALAGCLGVPLDNVERFEIAPASVSVVDMGPGWDQVKLLNGR